jgi:hypothetical protein
MSTETPIEESGWYFFEKHYRNACDRYAIKITDYIRERFGTEQYMLEYVGENTHGGHNYGYRIECKRYSRKPSKKLNYEVLEFGPVTTMELNVAR